MSCRGGFSCVSGCEVLRWKSFTAEHALFALSWVGGAQAGWPGSTLSSFKLCFLPAKHTESDVFTEENSTTAHLNFFPFNMPNVSYHYMASNIFYDEGFF